MRNLVNYVQEQSKGMFALNVKSSVTEGATQPVLRTSRLVPSRRTSRTAKCSGGRAVSEGNFACIRCS